ncbi:MAG: hypothetical protein AB8I08_09350 [Sandaracinaceae bacterium]
MSGRRQQSAMMRPSFPWHTSPCGCVTLDLGHHAAVLRCAEHGGGSVVVDMADAPASAEGEVSDG